MNQIFEEFLQFLQQGIAAIFRFVALVWTWSIDQIGKMMQVPWESWPLEKQVVLIIVLVAMAYFLFFAARQLWFAGVRVLASFASFLGALVYTLPAILLAGCIALAGLWIINNANLSSLRTITGFERTDTGASSASSNRPSGQTTGQSRGETTGSR